MQSLNLKMNERILNLDLKNELHHILYYLYELLDLIYFLIYPEIFYTKTEVMLNLNFKKQNKNI